MALGRLLQGFADFRLGYYRDHLDLFAICECSGDYTYDSYARLDKTVWAGIQYLLLKKGPAASSLFETGGFWYADPTAASPDIQFHLGLGSGIEAGVEKLSMGMSGDYETAVAFGATSVRVGSAIFGAR